MKYLSYVFENNELKEKEEIDYEKFVMIRRVLDENDYPAVSYRSDFDIVLVNTNNMIFFNKFKFTFVVLNNTDKCLNEFLNLYQKVLKENNVNAKKVIEYIADDIGIMEIKI